MNDFFFNLGVTAVLSILEVVIKNPKSRATYRRVMTKLRDKLNEAYPVENYPLNSSRIPDNKFKPE